MKNRRFADRRRSEGAVQIAGYDQRGDAFKIDCSVTDFSEEGLGVRASYPVAVLTPVSVVVGTDTYDGEIRYCRKSPFGHYALGIRIASPN